MENVSILAPPRRTPHFSCKDRPIGRQARANLEQVLDLHARGLTRALVSARYPLARTVEAMQHITSRGVTGKVVLVPAEGG